MADVRVTEGRLVAASSESEITTVLVEPNDAIALMMLATRKSSLMNWPTESLN